MSNPSAQLAQKPSFKWETQRILILDKDDQFRFMARTLFQRQRTNEVLSTASMAEAVLHLMAAPVNACLVGVAETEPAGIEFLRWLRDPKASPCPDVPVTALTDSKDPRFIQKVCQFGIEGLLRKPVSQEGLTRRISQMIIEPKRMVIAPGYLGPDRRIGEGGDGFSGQDRRRPSEPVFTEDRPKPAVVLSSKPPAPKPEPARTIPTQSAPPRLAVMPPEFASSKPTAQQAPPLTAAQKPPPPPVEARPAAPPTPPPPPPAPPVVAKPVTPPPPPPVPMAAKPTPPMAAAPQTPKPAAPPVAARPPAPAAPVTPVYKPPASGTKLDLGEAPTPAANAGTKLAMEAAPAAAKPVLVAAPPPAAATPAPAPAPEKPKVKPAKLTFDLGGVLDGHRNWVLSRGTEGGRAALSRQNMTGVDLSGAILTQADLTYCRLNGAECSEAKLDGADLRYAEMAGADLTEAVLGAARLRHVNLEGAKLKGANLRGADLSGADLRGADLEGVQMHGATLLDTQLGDTDLSAAEGLTQAQINKAKRNMKTKLPPGLRLNLGEEEQVAVAEAS